jgi:glycerol-3-phosphate dehydrogenase
MADAEAETLVVTSQGIHLVFDRSFLRSDTALMVPKTSDGRVLFVIPWHGHAVAGTTDTPLDAPCLEPRPLDEEIEFILETAGQYLMRPPTRADVLSVYVGLRPLVKGDGKTSALSRDHVIHVDPSGLLTITGGKWTTYRHMAEDCVDHCITLGRLRDVPCRTRDLRIHGYLDGRTERSGADIEGWRTTFDALAVYGTDAVAVRGLAAGNAALGEQLDADLPYTGAEIVWAARQEMSRGIEDALARRTRALFLNAKSAMAMAPWRNSTVSCSGDLLVFPGGHRWQRRVHMSKII